MEKTEFLFSGDLINGEETFKWLKFNLPKAHGVSSLASCYVKNAAVIQLLEGAVGIKGRMLARWRPGDLIQGSSDLEVYETLKKVGWDLYISENFHGKVYRLPSIGTLVGSANATLSGLSIFRAGNDEISTIVANNDKNEAVVENLFKDAVLVTDEIYSEIVQFIADNRNKVTELNDLPSLVWPSNISGLFPIFAVEKLFVSDCFSGAFSNHPSDLDLSLLGLTNLGSLDSEIISEAISKTKIYKWLLFNCKEVGGEVRFGDLTHRLHNALLDDPLPYRSSVKNLLSNLLSWVEVYKKKEVRISTPRYAQVIELI